MAKKYKQNKKKTHYRVLIGKKKLVGSLRLFLHLNHPPQFVSQYCIQKRKTFFVCSWICPQLDGNPMRVGRPGVVAWNTAKPAFPQF